MNLKSHSVSAKSPSLVRRDSGASFVEILVAIVLLGLVVVATLTALRTTIVSSNVNKDHASAHAWLQAAADAVHAADYEECDGTAGEATTIANVYEISPEFAAAPVPADWSIGATIDIVDVDFWSADSTGVEQWGDVCQSEASGLADNFRQLQLLTIEVVGPDGGVRKSVEVIRGE